MQRLKKKFFTTILFFLGIGLQDHEEKDVDLREACMYTLANVCRLAR